MRLAGPGATAVVNLDGALVGVAVETSEAGTGPHLLSSSVVRRGDRADGRVAGVDHVTLGPTTLAWRFGDEDLFESVGVGR